MLFESASKMEARFSAGIEQGDLQLGIVEIGMKFEAVFGRRDNNGVPTDKSRDWRCRYAQFVTTSETEGRG